MKSLIKQQILLKFQENIRSTDVTGFIDLFSNSTAIINLIRNLAQLEGKVEILYSHGEAISYILAYHFDLVYEGFLPLLPNFKSGTDFLWVGHSLPLLNKYISTEDFIHMVNKNYPLMEAERVKNEIYLRVYKQ